VHRAAVGFDDLAHAEVFMHFTPFGQMEIAAPTGLSLSPPQTPRR
jgi:hypothetical protein